MAHETNWLRTRITAATVTLLAGAALIAGNSVIWTADAIADEASETTMTVPAQQQAVTIKVNGHFTDNAAHEALDIINAARAEEGLDPVELSGSLSTLAQTRAVEYAIDPTDAVYGFLDGSGTVFTAGLDIVNETLGTARQGSSVSELINQWFAANEDDPTAAGTYAALMSPDVTQIGFALFTGDDNTVSFALEVAEGDDLDSGSANTATTASSAVSVALSRLTALLTVPETMDVGDSATAAYTLLMGNTPVTLVDEALWHSSDANVVSIDAASGTLSAIDAGTATISLATDDVVLGTSTVIVEGQAVDASDDTNDDTYDIDPGYTFNEETGDDTTTTPEPETEPVMPEFSDVTTEPDYGDTFIDENIEPTYGDENTAAGETTPEVETTYEEPAPEVETTYEEPAPEVETTYEEPASEAETTPEVETTSEVETTYDEPASDVTSEPEAQPGPDFSADNNEANNGEEIAEQPMEPEQTAGSDGSAVTTESDGSTVHQEVTNVNTDSDATADGIDTSETPSYEILDGNTFGENETINETPSEEPTGEEVTTEEPNGEEVTTEEPSGEEVITEEPNGEETIAEEPTGEEVTTEEPNGEEVTTEEPSGEETPAEELNGEEVTTEEPSSEETIAEEPSGETTDDGTADDDNVSDRTSNDGTSDTANQTFDDIPSIIPDDEEPSDGSSSDGSGTSDADSDNVSEGEADGVNDEDQAPDITDTSGSNTTVPDTTEPGIVEPTSEPETEPEPEPEPEPENPTIVSIDSELPIIYVQTSDDGSGWLPTEDTVVDVTLSDGENTIIVIEPDAWTVNGPDSQGIMTLTFTIEDTELIIVQVVQFVNVLPGGLEHTYTVGDAIELPDIWNATYEGAEVDIAVTWDAIPDAALTTPGTYTINGTLAGDLGTVVATLTVEAAAPTIQQASNPAAVTTTVGTAPVLPSTVSVTYSDETTGSAKVTWDSVDPSLYAKAGSFTVSGTVEGTVLTVSITVIVEEPAPTITGVATSYVTTVAGETPQLPATVEVTWSDGVTALMAVTWDSYDYNLYMQAGSFTVSGTIEGHDDVRATCVVTVEALPTPTNVLTIEDVSTPAGTAPALPDTVEVLYSDGTVKAYGVVWNSIDPAAYHNGGSFIVDGKVDGLGWTVSVKVIVADPYITGVQNNLSAQTIVGIAPKLPDTASVRWSNGDITSEPVTWPTIDKDLYEHTGTFTVIGLVAGYEIPCTVTVTEQVVQTADTVAPTGLVALIAGLVGIGAIAAAVTLIIRSRRARQ